MAWAACCRRSPTAAAGKAGRQTGRCFCLLTLFNLLREALPNGACLRSSTALLIFFKNPDLRATLVVLQLRFSIDVYVAFQYHLHADIDFLMRNISMCLAQSWCIAFSAFPADFFAQQFLRFNRNVPAVAFQEPCALCLVLLVVDPDDGANHMQYFLTALRVIDFKPELVVPVARFRLNSLLCASIARFPLWPSETCQHALCRVAMRMQF